MPEKIHCDLLDFYGSDWANINNDQIQCLISTIQGMPLIQEKDDLYGFVGTTALDDIVGGFLVIQFPTEFLSYNPDKTAKMQLTNPAERVFFVLFPKVGRVLLQNRRFQILPIDMETVHIRFKNAFVEVCKSCKIVPPISLAPTIVEVKKSDLLEAYETSQRVVKLQVSDPTADNIPEDIVYYNPQRERNKILRDSRLHDYPQLKEIDLTAKQNGDLRSTHLGQDLVHATTDDTTFMMEFEDKNSCRRVLRKLIRAKFEFHINIDGEVVTKDALQQVIELLEKEAALNIGTSSSKPSDPQLSLF